MPNNTVDIATLGLAVDASQVDGAAQSLDRLTQAGERTENATQRWQRTMAGVGAELQRNAQATGIVSKETQDLLNKYDPLGAKLRTLQADMAALRSSMGNSTDPGVMRAFQALEEQTAKTMLLMKQAGLAEAAGFDTAAKAAERGALSTAGARRELIVLAHEAVQGNFSRMPGSFMVLAERMSFSEALTSPLAVGLAAVAAAAAVVGKAVHDGAAEMEGMNHAMQSTNDFAGVTRGSMRELAQEMTVASTMTIGSAKTVVTELVASGQIGAQSLGVVANLTQQYAKLTGQSAEDAAPKLIKLFADPLKGAQQLNETMHFLTVEQMNHIRALEESGRSTEAQKVLAEALNAQLQSQTQHVGALSYAWNNLKKSASEAWDSMTGLGREKTLDEALARARGELDKLSVRAPNSKEFLDKQAEVNRLAGQQRQEQAAASAKAEAAERIKAQNEANKVITQYSLEARRDEIRQRIKLLQEHPELPNQADALAQARVALANIKPADVKLTRAENAFQSAYSNLGAGADKVQAEIDQLQQYGLAAGRANQAAMEFETTYGRLKALPANQKALLVDMAARKDELEQAKKNLEGYLRLENELGSTLAKNAETIRQTQEQPARLAMRERERTILDATNKLEVEAARLREKARQDIKDPELYAKALDDINQRLGEQKDKLAQATAYVYDYSHSWEFGATKAVNDYLDAVSNAAAQSNKLWSDAFKGMEDALVNFVKTGKLDFKSLTDSIVSDLIRIQVQNSITKPLAQAVSDSGGFGGLFSGLGSSIGHNMFSGLFGGGRAVGGPVDAGTMYQVNEKGDPELLTVGGRDFLMMGAQGGQVTPLAPAQQSSGGGAAPAINYNPVIQIDARGADAGAAKSIEATMRQFVAQNQTMFVSIIDRAYARRGIRSGLTS